MVASPNCEFCEKIETLKQRIVYCIRINSMYKILHKLQRKALLIFTKY